MSDTISVSSLSMALRASPSFPLHVMWCPEPETAEEDGNTQVLPNEILLEIVSHVQEAQDLVNVRLASACLKDFSNHPVGRSIAKSTLFPRMESMVNMLRVLKDPNIAKHVHDITILAEGLAEHVNGYSWAWEDFELQNKAFMTAEDQLLVERINKSHQDDILHNGSFISKGIYRKMLKTILRRCTNLKTLNIRKLEVGEHIPGWEGAKLLQQLSFYKPDMDVNDIFYGDWQYDRLHKRVTRHLDEFEGVWELEDGAGPQATFLDDLKAAATASGRQFQWNFVHAAPELAEALKNFIMSR